MFWGLDHLSRVLYSSSRVFPCFLGKNDIFLFSFFILIIVVHSYPPGF